MLDRIDFESYYCKNPYFIFAMFESTCLIRFNTNHYVQASRYGLDIKIMVMIFYGFVMSCRQIILPNNLDPLNTLLCIRICHVCKFKFGNNLTNFINLKFCLFYACMSHVYYIIWRKCKGDVKNI